MVTQIKSAEGYDDRFSVYVVNDFQNQDETITHYGNLDHVTQHPYGGLSDYLNNYNWKYFVRNWCGFSPDWKNGDELLHLPEVQNMTHYPDNGSIMVIDDKVVIRFCRKKQGMTVLLFSRRSKKILLSGRHENSRAQCPGCFLSFFSSSAHLSRTGCIRPAERPPPYHAGPERLSGTGRPDSHNRDIPKSRG